MFQWPLLCTHHIDMTAVIERMHFVVNAFISFIECTLNPLPLHFSITSPSEFLAEIINNQHSPIYIVICDPLLKLLVIPLHHVIEYVLIDFARVYIWYMQEGISLPVKD